MKRVGKTLAGLFGLFVWGWKRPQSMPATYAPGPRCNAVYCTTGFWACQDLNTRYLVSLLHRPLDVGGLPVEIPLDELGTAWAQAGGNAAKLAYWTGSRRARRRVSVERSGGLLRRAISPCPVDSVERSFGLSTGHSATAPKRPVRQPRFIPAQETRPP